MPVFTGNKFGFGAGPSGPVGPGDPWPAPNGFTATGGTKSDAYQGADGNWYISHVFTSPGTFAVSALSSAPTVPSAVDYLVVGAGGGGGCRGGAGGAGALRSSVGSQGGGNSSASAMPVSTASTTSSGATSLAGRVSMPG